MTIHTGKGTWVIPPMRACWLPALEAHCVETSTRLDMLSVYCRGDVLPLLPRDTSVVQVSGLLRELILAVQESSPAASTDQRFSRMAMVLADQIKPQRFPGISMPPPLSLRLRRIADALATDPADSRTLHAWAEELGISTRTLARTFEREARMTFVEYRRQARLYAAVTKLAAGEPVSSVAYDVGFSSTSNFITAFRKATGATPMRYFREAGTRA